MIHESNHFFLLNTANTSYAFRVMETGHLEHLYYGKKLRVPKAGHIDALVEKHVFAPGNTLVYDKEHMNFSPEDICLEMSSLGKGDIREPFIEITHADGSMTSDFVFDSFTISKGKEEFKTLPGSYDESGDVEHLTVADRMEETMFLGLRLRKGVGKEQFRSLYGCEMEEVYGQIIQKHVKDGLLVNGDFVALTEKGIDVSNYVMAQFLLEK